MTVGRVPIHQVRADGEVRALGAFEPASRALILDGPGFPLLGPGRYAVEGDLPWVFWEMCPSGFFGRAFARVHPEHSLAPDPRLWRPAQCLDLLARFGEDLPGNLIVGEVSLARFEAARRWRREHPGPTFDAAGRVVPGPYDPDLARIWREDAGFGPSSLGGDRPKLALEDRDGTGWLVKFSPPIETVLGQRWADLLLVERECAATLAEAGVAAVDATRAPGLNVSPDGAVRRTIWIRRYDRLAGFGRRGAVTLYFLAHDRYGPRPAPEVVAELAAEGHLPPDAARTARLVHEFSRAIGNDDTHLGNYGLVFDDDGRASLAPMFDVLPMALAPRHDELPDASLAPVAPSEDPEVARWVDRLVERIDAHPEVSADFKTRWRGMLGR